MPVLPPTKLAKIQFCEQHYDPFNTNAVAIGTTVLAVTDLQTKTTAARAAFDAQRAAYDAAQSATNTYNMAVAAMTSAVADILKSIKTKAATAGDGVYSLANIPVPSGPTPLGPPGTPTTFGADLQTDGTLRLKWKCKNPAGSSGTLYQVYRSVDGGAQVYLGGAGKRQFVDTTVPTGASSITYTIQATRTTAVGVAADFLVKFGTDSSGVTTISVVGNPGKATPVAA